MNGKKYFTFVLENLIKCFDLRVNYLKKIKSHFQRVLNFQVAVNYNLVWVQIILIVNCVVIITVKNKIWEFFFTVMLESFQYGHL